MTGTISYRLQFCDLSIPTWTDTGIHGPTLAQVQWSTETWAQTDDDIVAEALNAGDHQRATVIGSRQYRVVRITRIEDTSGHHRPPIKSRVPVLEFTVDLGLRLKSKSRNPQLAPTESWEIHWLLESWVDGNRVEMAVYPTREIAGLAAVNLLEDEQTSATITQIAVRRR